MNEPELLNTLAHGDSAAFEGLLYAGESLKDFERRSFASYLRDYRTPVDFDHLKPIQARRSGPFRLIVLQISWLYLDPQPYRPLLLMETEQGLKIVGTDRPFIELRRTDLATRTKDIAPLTAWYTDWITERRQPQSEQRGVAAANQEKPSYAGVGLLMLGLLCFLIAFFCMILGFHAAAEDPNLPAVQLARSIKTALLLIVAGVIVAIVGLCVIQTQKRRNGAS